MRAQQLTIAYGTHRVLDALDLTVQAGSFTVLLGPSGCGKSTLLGAFAGLVPPTSGTVSDGDRPINRPEPRRGIVFQRDILFPWTDMAGNLGFALRAAGVPKAQRRERMEELLAAVGLDGSVLARRPFECSGGMRQRVGLARMLAGNPQVMLLDEPFAALDAQTRLRMQDLVTSLWAASGRTVLFVTHDVDEAVRLADRLLVMRDGRIHADVPNPLPRPRPAASLADLPDYSALRRRLHEQLAPELAA